MVSRKIAVLGGGNGAHCMAADMKLKGHTDMTDKEDECEL